jgi:hypothetical protein
MNDFYDYIDVDTGSEGVDDDPIAYYLGYHN